MENNTNTLSQESLDSLNKFIADFERKLADDKARAEQEFNARIERAYREREAFEATMTYKVSNIIYCFISGLYELFSICLIGLLKFVFVALVMLLPFFIVGIIENYL